MLCLPGHGMSHLCFLRRGRTLLRCLGRLGAVHVDSRAPPPSLISQVLGRGPGAFLHVHRKEEEEEEEEECGEQEDEDDSEPEVIESSDEDEETGKVPVSAGGADGANQGGEAAENGDAGYEPDEGDGVGEEDANDEEGEEEEEDGEEDKGAAPEPQRKKLEPYEVPTSGHFFLHDDRTELKPRGEQGEDEAQERRPRKKLWADEPRWQHDKFVEDDDDTPAQDEERRRRTGASGRGRGRDKRTAGSAPENKEVLPTPEIKPSTHARAAREGKGGGQTRRGRGGRVNEREEADPMPMPEASMSRGGLRGRGRGVAVVGQQQESQPVPVVAMGGALRTRGRGRDTQYDRAVAVPGSGGYQGAERGGIVGGMRGMRGGVRAGPQHMGQAVPRGSMVPRNGETNAGPSQQLRAQGGAVAGGSRSGVGSSGPGVSRQEPRRRVMNSKDSFDDEHDPFPALTKSQPSSDQAVMVNVAGMDGGHPMHRTALDGGGDNAGVAALTGMPTSNANKPGGRRTRDTSITPSLANAPQFTPHSSLPNSADRPMPTNGSMGMSNMLTGNMPMVNGPGQQQQQQQQQPPSMQQQQQYMGEMQRNAALLQQYTAEMYDQQYGTLNQFSGGAAQPQYYAMMNAGYDGQPQGTYYFSAGSNQSMGAGIVGGMAAGMVPGGMGSGSMGPGGNMGPHHNMGGSMYGEYQQSLAAQEMQMQLNAGGLMGPLPTGAMPFQPSVGASNNQGGGTGPAHKPPVSRRYSQMSFGNHNTLQMDEMNGQ